MLPKEITTILEKHQENNSQPIQLINDSISNIISQLEVVRGNLSKEIINLYDNNIIDEQVENLHADISSLITYIKSVNYIKQPEVVISTETANEIEQTAFSRQEELQQLFDDGIRPFLVSNSTCPECGESVVPFTIYYCRKNDEQIIEESVEWSRCPICRRWYVLDKWLTNFDLSNTNITLNRKYYDDIPSIGIYSVIVLSNALHCSLNHKTKDIVAKIPVIDENGNLSYAKVNASYCYECDRFTILRDDFNAIKDVVICKVIDETSEIIMYGGREEVDVEQRKSILFNYGYNVQTKANLSEEQRHTILSSVIEAGIMNKRDIVNHITTLIDRGSKISSWKLATYKWKQDREFVSQYQNGDLPEIIFNEVILKHKKLA